MTSEKTNYIEKTDSANKKNYAARGAIWMGAGALNTAFATMDYLERDTGWAVFGTIGAACCYSCAANDFVQYGKEKK